MVFYAEFTDVGFAIDWEKRIKKWSKAKKEVLINDEYEKLPNSCGVYYFLDDNKEVIYVGKANDIKKRVYQHFSKKDNRARTQNFRRSVAHIDYEVTGSELIALLFESAEIKRLLPKFNRAQRRVLYPYGLYSYIDGNGYERLNVAKTNPKLGKPITTYTGLSDGRNHLFRMNLHILIYPISKIV